MLLENFEQAYLLGLEDMDQTHREFVELLNKLDSASKADFIPLFAELLAHTQAHFTTENDWMQQCAFPAIREHIGEHERVLGELHRFNQRVAAGNVMMGRAYVREQLPGWFELHAQTMDSALAAVMKAHRGEM
jgi:hemerythrin-like metal-binding protein